MQGKEQVKKKKKKRTSKNCAISKDVAHVTGIVEEEREN